jgi:hypothetical protein
MFSAIILGMALSIFSGDFLYADFIMCDASRA